MESTFCNWYNRNQKETGVSDEQVDSLLQSAKTIAIVGISRDPHKDSHYVGRYLKNAGYKIVPVNPGAEEILGETAYPDLKSIPFPVDVVDIFRRPEEIPAAINQALEIQPKAIWLQLGTGSHPEEKKKVEARGIVFIQNRCMKVDHQFLVRTKQKSAVIDS